jgi:hypothetical protein
LSVLHPGRGHGKQPRPDNVRALTGNAGAGRVVESDMSTTRTTPRWRLAARRGLLLAAAVGLLAGLAGCGRAASGPERPGPAGTPTGASCPASSATVTLTEADNGRAICLAPGTRIEVYLHGSDTAPWSPIQLDGAALRPVASGKGALARDVTGGFFAAERAGTARLSSSRPACPSAPAGAVRCGAEQGFQVEVTVH